MATEFPIFLHDDPYYREHQVFEFYPRQYLFITIFIYFIKQYRGLSGFNHNLMDASAESFTRLPLKGNMGVDFRGHNHLFFISGFFPKQLDSCRAFPLKI
jgi:hypothetical protein